MHELERLVNLSADVLVSVLTSRHDIKQFAIRAYVPKSHQQFDETFQFARGENIFRILQELKASHDPQYTFAFFSRVETDEGVRHYPMLDFSNSKVEYGVDRVKSVLVELGEKNGVILRSGRSFHYYGFRLLTQETWVAFLKQASEFDEIGKKYIGHQFEDGGCTLRITTNELKPQMPVVVAVLN
jgi:hypothetical protein